MHPGEVCEYASYFPDGQHDRDALGTLRARYRIQLSERLPKHLAIKEQQRVQSLVLRAGAYVTIDREMRQEGLDFGRAHVLRMAKPVKANESQNPCEVGLLDAITQVACTYPFTHPVKQSLRCHWSTSLSNMWVSLPRWSPGARRN